MVLYGDCNEILNIEEKIGGHLRRRQLMEDFRDALNACELKDMGYLGLVYTWSNKREGNVLVQERLDCGVRCMNWHILFLNSIVHHLDF